MDPLLICECHQLDKLRSLDNSPHSVPFLSTNGFVCPQFHNPADFVLEIASGEHKDAIQKLVCAVNEDQKQHLGTLDSSVSFANEKTDSNKSLVDLPSGTGNELKKDPSEIAPDSSSALPSKQQEICLVKPRESFTKDIEQSRTQTFAFPNSTWTQFWIIFKRTLLQGIRDPTLTQMRLVAHFAVGAIISLIYYGIGNDAGKIQSNSHVSH
jgi:ATP-binding cassette, subfamily G (WHITE), member 1